jgi:hypothetical protein
MEILKQRTDRYQVGEAAQAAMMPAGVTPQLLEQIMAMLRAQGLAPAAAAAPPRAGSNGTNGHHGKNGHGDPRAILPLDRDERGFGGF